MDQLLQEVSSQFSVFWRFDYLRRIQRVLFNLNILILFYLNLTVNYTAFLRSVDVLYMVHFSAGEVQAQRYVKRGWRVWFTELIYMFNFRSHRWGSRDENSHKHGKHAWGTNQRKWGTILDIIPHFCVTRIVESSQRIINIQIASPSA